VCRHCPVTPVYNGAFRIVGREIFVIERHWPAGSRGSAARNLSAIRISSTAHTRDVDCGGPARGISRVGYDATIKIEHLRQHRKLLATLKDTGCLFVTSAVESLDDAVLQKLEKNHTRRREFRGCGAGDSGPSGWRFSPRSSRSRPGPRSKATAICCERWPRWIWWSRSRRCSSRWRLLITATSRAAGARRTTGGAVTCAYDAKALIYP